jgi:hypothetical protein
MCMYWTVRVCVCVCVLHTHVFWGGPSTRERERESMYFIPVAGGHSRAVVHDPMG